MSLEPLYRIESLRQAYQLRYSWTGWLKSPWACPGHAAIIERIKPLWEQDGLRLLEHVWRGDHIQTTFSAKPEISPVVIAARAKGRLQYALRKEAGFSGFTRKVAVRSIGDNTSGEVSSYIASQVRKEDFVDWRFADALGQSTRKFPAVELSAPSESARGRYWYNLHVVLVAARRDRLHDIAQLRTLYDWSLKIANRKGHRIAAISVICRTICTWHFAAISTPHRTRLHWPS